VPRKRTISRGSVFAYRGKLRIKLRVPNAVDKDGRPKYIVKATGLSDTARGRDLAQQMLEQMYMEMYMGIGKSVATSRPMMSVLFEEFLDSKLRTDKTITNYRLAYRRIVRSDYPVDRDRIEADIREFVKRSEMRPASVNTYLRQFRAFLTWLDSEQDLQVPKKVMSRYGQKTRTNVRDFTDAEVDAMTSDTVDPELTDLLVVMVETGARPVDVLTLQWDQVNLEKKTVTWLNKITKREEVRPISSRTHDALQRRRYASDRFKVFRWSHASLSPLTKQFRALLERVGVDHDGRSLKHLRTTFKRRLMEKGLPFEVQMYLMRHSSPDVTLGNYTAINIESHILE
jgi:integrase